MSNDITRNLRVDGNRNAIQGGHEISTILNVPITAGGWTALTMPADTSCKQLVMVERTAGTWRLSNDSFGTNYLTVAGPLAIEAAFGPDAIIGYAQMSAGSGVLEILCTD